MFFWKRNKQKEKDEGKFFFGLFGGKGTVAEPWASDEEIFEIYKESMKELKAIMAKKDERGNK